MKKTNKNKLKNFTLIEMITVLAIIGVISAITLPFFFSFYTGQELKTSARIVASVLRSAKSYAAAKNVKYEVNFHIPQSNKLEMTIYEDPEGSTPIQVGKTEKLEVSSGITISSTFPDKSIIIGHPDSDLDTETYFTPQGTCDGGTIEITYSAKNKEVDIKVLGNNARVSISDIKTPD